MLSRKEGKNVKNIECKGLIMHTGFAVATNGLALGLLDQKIHNRPAVSEEIQQLKKLVMVMRYILKIKKV